MSRRIRIGCQTYTWEMLGDAWQGSLDDICAEIAEAGYEGIEISSNVLGDAVDRPEEVRLTLKRHGLELAAIAFSRPSGFTVAAELDGDLAAVERTLAFMGHFPSAMLVFGGASSADSAADRPDKIDQACRFYREAGRLAREAGIRPGVHPHSAHGSVLETAEEYDRMLDQVRGIVEFGPDTGHIVRGGQQLTACIAKHAGSIAHIHFKDVLDRKWVPLGHGACDFAGTVGLLLEAGYTGWIVAEEEFADTRESRKKYLRENRDFMERLLQEREH